MKSLEHYKKELECVKAIVNAAQKKPKHKWKNSTDINPVLLKRDILEMNRLEAIVKSMETKEK